MGLAHLRTLSAALAAAVMALSASAHEIGTTEVRVKFQRNHTYSIDVIVAPQSTLNKIERAAGLPRSHDLNAAQLARQLSAQRDSFLRAVDVRFDQKREMARLDPPRVAAANDPLRPSYAVMHLSGEIPAKARTFTWRYALAYGSYSLSLATEGRAEPMRVWLDAGDASAPFVLSKEVLPPSRLEVIRQYLVLGFTHILPKGTDHILFVLGMFLLTASIAGVLAQVTAFTVAHSITLGLTMYGVVSISPRIVEPAIALSIAYIAIENVVTKKLQPWRVALVFAFGLIHGMGFAGVLRELGLPRSQFGPALVSFNAGVELGQLSVIAIAFLLCGYWWRNRNWYRPRLVVPVSLVIGTIGLFWTVQRLTS